MARMITVKPAKPGQFVPDELGRPYPDSGKTVKRTPYVIRRLKDESLVEVEKQSPKKKGDDK